MANEAELVERLRDPVNNWNSGGRFEAAAAIELLAAERDAAQAKLAEAVEVIKFYRDCWDTHPGDSGPGGNYPQEPVCNPDCDLLEDGGNLARAFLTSLEDKTADGGDK